MNAPEKIRLTEFSHGGGCGCKIAPAVLTEILASTPIRGLPKELLVGSETADDAAVYRLNDSQALVATTDFFTPSVDDPYDFGRIAATTRSPTSTRWARGRSSRSPSSACRSRSCRCR